MGLYASLPCISTAKIFSMPPGGKNSLAGEKILPRKSSASVSGELMAAWHTLQLGGRRFACACLEARRGFACTLSHIACLEASRDIGCRRWRLGPSLPAEVFKKQGAYASSMELGLGWARRPR